MTENECIEKLEIFPKWNMEDLWLDADDMEDLVSTCIKAIKENKRYRATGTVKECREARKKQKPEIPDIWGDGYDKEATWFMTCGIARTAAKVMKLDSMITSFARNAGRR